MKRRQRILNAALILLLVAVLCCGWLLVSELRKKAAMDAASDTAQGARPADSELMDFADLLAQNPDVVAWLTVPGTAIDYPVLQSDDNNTYLRQDLKKQYNVNGSLFLDYRARADFSDFNNVIYGHHMKSGRMFQNLVKFRDKAFFDEHGEAVLYTPGATYRLEIFAALLADSRSEFYEYRFPDPNSRTAHLQDIRDKAVCLREIEIGAEDRLLAMSTCSYEYESARTIVIARITRSSQNG